MKRRIRLTERDLHRIVKESVKKILKEEASLPTVEQVIAKFCPSENSSEFKEQANMIYNEYKKYGYWNSEIVSEYGREAFADEICNELLNLYPDADYEECTYLADDAVNLYVKRLEDYVKNNML